MTKTLLPFRQLLSQADVHRLLGRKVADDCMAAGWIKPRAIRKTRNGRTKIFALSDVKDCEARILNGEYPNP